MSVAVELILDIAFDSDVAPNEADDITQSLRTELLEDSIEDASVRTSAGQEPGAKGGDLAIIGELAVIATPIVLRSVFVTIQEWIKHRPVRSITLKTGKESIEIVGVSTLESTTALEAFIRKIEN